MKFVLIEDRGEIKIWRHSRRKSEPLSTFIHQVLQDTNSLGLLGLKIMSIKYENDTVVTLETKEVIKWKLPRS